MLPPTRSSHPFIAAIRMATLRTRSVPLPGIMLVFVALVAGTLWFAPQALYAQLRLPTPTPNPNATPARANLPEALVLVERLRLRAGPGEEYPILERVFTGDQLRVDGRIPDCTWLLVTAPSGMQGWISADATLVQMESPCSSLRPSNLIVATPTVSPTPTATRTATPTRTSTPTLSPTPLTAPEIALRPAISPNTPTPVATATPRPRPTATAAPTTVVRATVDPFAALAGVGPNSVNGLTPADGTESRQRIPFAWSSDVALAPGQLFEVAFWERGTPQEEAQGWTGATQNYTLSANTYEQVPGDYYWGVWLGATVDGVYQRLRYLGGGNLLRVLPEASLEESAPSATNCPPTAPCK